jgi:hypothetical protein
MQDEFPGAGADQHPAATAAQRWSGCSVWEINKFKEQ